MTANSSIAAKQNILGQGTVDATGKCVIEFPPFAVGVFDTGSITVFDSPGSATWSIIIDGISTDKTNGSSTCGGVQVGTNDVLQITATNLAGYIGQTFHATFAAVETPANNTDLITPGHDAVFPALASVATLLGTTSLSSLASGFAANIGPVIPDGILSVCAVVTAQTLSGGPNTFAYITGTSPNPLDPIYFVQAGLTQSGVVDVETGSQPTLFNIGPATLATLSVAMFGFPLPASQVRPSSQLGGGGMKQDLVAQSIITGGGGPSALLGPPPTKLGWRIKLLQINQAAFASSVGNFANITGHTTGAAFLSKIVGIAGTDMSAAITPNEMDLTEGVDVSSGTGVGNAVGFTAVYRAVTIT